MWVYHTETDMHCLNGNDASKTCLDKTRFLPKITPKILHHFFIYPPAPQRQNIQPKTHLIIHCLTGIDWRRLPRF